MLFRSGVFLTVFEKPPSAELRPNQKDTDSLPSYEVLDQILRCYVEESRTPGEIARELGLALELVSDIAKKIDRNEYKRQQAALGLKVTSKAFGIGRRFPIAQKHQSSYVDELISPPMRQDAGSPESESLHMRSGG